MDILLLLMKIDKEECQRPQDDSYHKISHAHCPWLQQSAADGTPACKHQCHDSSNLSILARCGR